MSFDSHEISEAFTDAEASFKVEQATWNQKADQVRELTGEQRKAAVNAAEEALDKMEEEVETMHAEILNASSSPARIKVNKRLRTYEAAVKDTKAKQQRWKLYGTRDDRYRDDPTGDAGHNQRQQLLSNTDRLNASTGRLKGATALAGQTEDIAIDIMRTLQAQGETIQHTGDILHESEGYVDRSVKTLRGMSRRMATNRIITIAIITVLVLLIMAVIYSKFK